MSADLDRRRGMLRDLVGRCSRVLGMGEASVDTLLERIEAAGHVPATIPLADLAQLVYELQREGAA